MRTFSQIVEALEAVDLDLPDNTLVFEALLAELLALRTPKSVGPLLGLLRDGAKHDELMFSIIHGIEVFEDQVYVAEILSGAASLCSKAPRWASIVFMRILNSEPTRLELVRQLRESTPESKAAIKSLMERINGRSVQFLPKTVAVLVAAS